MEGDKYFHRKTIAKNVQAHNELNKISKFWEKCKAERGKVLDRELRHLSQRLGVLATERELSKHEFAELEVLLDDLEKAENESTPGAWILGNLVERHYYIEECRHKIERLLKRSRMHSHSDPAAILSLSQPKKTLKSKDPQHFALSAHDVALGIIELENKSPLPHAKLGNEKGVKTVFKQQPVASTSKKPYVMGEQSLSTGSTPCAKAAHPPSPGTSKQVDFKEEKPKEIKSIAFKESRDETELKPFPPSKQSVHEHSKDKVAGGSSVNVWQPLRKLGVTSSPAFKPKPDDHGITKESLVSHSVLEHGKKASRRRPSLASSSKTMPEVPELDFETLQNYYDYMSKPPCVSGRDHMVKGPVGHFTSDRNERRRILAIEAVLEKVYDYRTNKTMINPKDALNCRYLRLTPQNIAELEEQCRRRGIDPGLHAFSTEEEILEYFENRNQHSA